MSMTDIFRQSLSGVGFSQPYIDAALAISQGESGGNWQIRENPNYSPGRAREIFSAMRGLSDDQIRALSGNRERFFEAVYGPGTGPGRSLGNTQPGDGGRFYGRGMIQLTGRGNYERYARMTGHDIVNNPDLLISDPQVAMDVTAAYLSDRVDQRGDPVSDVRAAVAGGYDTAGYRMNIQNDRARFAQGGGEITFGSSAPELSGGGGLLSLSGESGGDNLQQEPARPSIWDNVPFLSDRDRRLRLAVAMQGLSTRPNQALVDLATQELGDRRDDERMNRTVAWLQSQPGGAQYAAALASGGVDAGSVITSYLQSQQPAPALPPVTINGQLVDPNNGQVIGDYRTPETPDPGYRQLTPEEVQERGLDPERSYQVNEENGQITPIGGSAPQTNVTVNNGGETAFSEETGKLLAREAADVVQEGQAAQSALGRIGSLRGLLESAPSGAAGVWTQMAGNLGIQFEGTGATQAAQAIINQLIPLQRPAGSGQMSDRDVELFRQSVPRLINTPEGNALILDTMEAIAEYDVARMGIARQLQLGQITPEQAFAAYAALGNPIPDSIRNGGATNEESAAPQQEAPRGMNVGGIDFSSMSVSEVDDLLRGGTLTPQQREAAIARIRQIAGN